MYVRETEVVHRQKGRRVYLFSDAGDQVTVRLGENDAVDGEDAIERARQVMVQMTLGTRGGASIIDSYESLGNGNFDDLPKPFRLNH